MNQLNLSAQPLVLAQILCNHLVVQENGSPLKLKKIVTGIAHIRFDGLTGDDGDQEHYKDSDKALLHYAFDHYQAWLAQLPGCTALLQHPGAFSENFSTSGITENNICIGDIFRVGSATIQVTEGREACNTMNQRFNDPLMNQKMHVQARTGWFYRVLDEGQAKAGDVMVLQERLHPEWTVARVLQCIYGAELNPQILEPLSKLPSLAKDWKTLILKRLETGKT